MCGNRNSFSLHLGTSQSIVVMNRRRNSIIFFN